MKPFNSQVDYVDDNTTVRCGSTGVLTQAVWYTTVFDFAQCIDANCNEADSDEGYTYTYSQFQTILKELSAVLVIDDPISPDSSITIPKGTQIRFAGFSSPSYVEITLPTVRASLVNSIIYFVDYVRGDLFDYVHWDDAAA